MGLIAGNVERMLVSSRCTLEKEPHGTLLMMVKKSIIKLECLFPAVIYFLFESYSYASYVHACLLLSKVVNLLANAILNFKMAV